jgi:CcmD family protein
MRIARWTLLLLLAVVPSVAAQGSPQPPPPKPAAQDGFVPIDQLAPKEELPAAPLVMAAYAVAWIVPFVYVWSIWRRLNRVETELADVTRRLGGGARR